ncbi:MAG: caspase family protein [Parcubacteria group bacterium]
MLKKIIFLSSVLVIAALVLSTSAVLAKNDEKYQAKDIKIHKKIELTSEQKAYFEEKGQPNLKGKPSKPSAALEAATGVLGANITGNKYAVLVGICDYPETANDICISDGDALNMQTALTAKYGFLKENIFYFSDEQAVKTDIKSKVDYIRSVVTSDDEVVFFFSGHGTTARVDDGDSEKIDEGIVVYGANNTFDYIWDGELRGWFSGFNTSRIVFIFDSCMAGGMNDVADPGRVVVMSSRENQSSYVYSGGINGEGVFSHWFVNLGMIQGEADGVNQAGKISQTVEVEESFQYAKDIISRLQVPVLSDSFINDLLL